jgi:hypothetical protein
MKSQARQADNDQLLRYIEKKIEEKETFVSSNELHRSRASIAFLKLILTAKSQKIAKIGEN